LDDQNYAGPEEPAKAEQHARADVDGNADESENIRTNVSTRQPAHHRIDDPLARPSDTCFKHLLRFLPVGSTRLTWDHKNEGIRMSRNARDNQGGSHGSTPERYEPRKGASSTERIPVLSRLRLLSLFALLVLF